MTRFLTPAKIGLLALIELYCDEAVTADAILPVLSFLTSHITDSPIRSSSTSPFTTTSSPWSKAERTTNLILSIHEFETVLSAHPVVRGMPGRRLWDSFLQKLWEIDSLDALHAFFDRLDLMLQPSREEAREEARRLAEAGEQPPPNGGIRLCKTSVFGVFVRRCRLEFSRLRFHDAADLWRGFVRYRQPTSEYLRKRIPALEGIGYDRVLTAADMEGDGLEGLELAVYGGSLTGFEDDGAAFSTDDAEGLLEFQVAQIQKHGIRVPIETREKLQSLLRGSSLIPSVSHYVNFLESWRAGDHPNAFESLHRYFDYTMQSRDRSFYHYALMNLAVLQADMGCPSEALDAMLQTVSTARENRDMTCLNFALNWLFHFGRAHPTLVRRIDPASTLGSGKETLAFLRVRAKEAGMWTLWCSALLAEAKTGLEGGESVATALESIVRSSQVIVEKGAGQMFPAHMALVASLWERLGMRSLARMTCEVALRAHARSGSFDDALKITCRLAMGLAERGRYDDALRLLDRLDDEGGALRVWKAHGYWRKYRGIVKLRRDLARNELDGAEELLTQLAQNGFDDLEPDLVFAVDVLRVEYLSRRGDLPAAFDVVEDLLASLAEDDTKDIALRVQLLLLKTNLLEKAGRPQRGFSIAVRAATLALRARLLPLLWHAVAALTSILTSLSEFAASSALLAAVVPRALETEDFSLAGALYSNLADAHMGLAGSASQTGREREKKEHLTKAGAALERAGAYFEGAEDVVRTREVVAKRAVIMRCLGDRELAAGYSARYVSLLEREEARKVVA